MSTEKRKPREWWLVIENDDPSDISTVRTESEAKQQQVWSGTMRTSIVHVREVRDGED